MFSFTSSCVATCLWTAASFISATASAIQILRKLFLWWFKSPELPSELPDAEPPGISAADAGLPEREPGADPADSASS